MASLNIPNALSALRFFLVPVFLYLVVAGEFRSAVAVYAVAGGTDAVDGFLARVLVQRTSLGAVLDPAADKLLQDTAYVSLAVVGVLPLWLSVPVILRDAVMFTAYAALRMTGRQVDVVPSVAGKATTLLQIATVVTALLFTDATDRTPFLALAAATAAITVYSGVEYAWREFRLQSERGGT